jgi:hypothetical protein
MRLEYPAGKVLYETLAGSVPADLLGRRLRSRSSILRSPWTTEARIAVGIGPGHVKRPDRA